MIIADTSALLAYFNRNEPRHSAVVAALDDVAEVAVSPYVIAELDYLIATRHGTEAELAVMSELSGGGWLLPAIGPGDLATAAAVVERYRDQDIGIADASLVVLAHTYGTRRIATLDHRHFSVLRPLDGGAFVLLPGTHP